MLLGAHESVAGGLHRALPRADADGCEAMQIWVRSSRAWTSKPLTEEDVRAFAMAAAASGVETVLAHDCYLVNLAAPDPGVHERSVETFADELDRCERLGVPLLVFHPGSPRDRGEEWGIRRLAATLDVVLARTRGGRVRPCLEVTAGQGAQLGWRFEHLAAVLDRVSEPERLAVCFDTQHAFAAGHDLAEAWEATWDAFDRTVGLARLAAFHLNDSKTAAGSRVDRHERLGRGRLGREVFRRLVNDPRFVGLPGIVETPTHGEEGVYREEVALLKGLREG